MPTPLADLESLDYLNLLLIAPARMGKTTLIGTAPRPIYVICSDPESKLDSAGRGDPALGMKDITFDPVNSVDGARLYDQFERAYQEAARGVRDGIYKTIVWDTLTSYAMFAIQHELRASDKSGNGSDSRRATELYNSNISSCVFRLSKLKANVVVMAHDYPSGGKIDGQLDKRGFGITPNIYGSIRAWVSGQFRDVGYLDYANKETKDGRVIRWHVQGCYGLGTNSRPGVEASPANLSEFLGWRKDKGVSGTNGVAAGARATTTALAKKPATIPAGGVKK
jgi:hypothetical protein